MNTERGFTLVELMVTLVVLAILSAVVIPLYTEQVRKSRRSDGRAALSAIAMAEERFRTTNGVYTNDLGNLTVSAPLQAGESESGFYDVAVTATTVSFTATATATGSQAEDSCTAMTINHLGVQAGTGTRCW